MGKIRTFICFELPDKIKEKIADLQDNLKPYGSGVRWTRPDSIHLTLKFLGDVQEEQITDITSAVEKASEMIPPLKIQVSGCGAFPNLRRPRVFWVGVKEDSGKLLELQSNIETALEELGFPKEKRNFFPHLTFGRVKSRDGIPEMTDFLKDHEFELKPFKAEQVIVMQSQLRPTGAVYTPLQEISLSAKK